MIINISPKNQRFSHLGNIDYKFKVQKFFKNDSELGNNLWPQCFRTCYPPRSCPMKISARITGALNQPRTQEDSGVTMLSLHCLRPLTISQLWYGN